MTVTGNRMEEDAAEPKGIQEQYLFSDDFDSFKPRRRIYERSPEPETSSGFELPRRFTIDCISARELEDLYRAYCAAEATTTRRRHIYDQCDKGESIEKECDNDASDELQCMPHHECMHSVSWSSDVVFNERCLQLSAMDDEERRATQKRMREKLVKKNNSKRVIEANRRFSLHFPTPTRPPGELVQGGQMSHPRCY